MKMHLILCSALALQTASTLAADSPWSGTWKLDPTQSHLTGDTFTLTQGRGTMLHYSDGSTANYDFGVDGKEYKTWKKFLERYLFVHIVKIFSAYSITNVKKMKNTIALTVLLQSAINVKNVLTHL